MMTLLLRLFFQSIISVTITLTAFKKKYPQFFSKVNDDASLIVNVVFLGKCDLRKVSSHLR